MPVSKTIGIVEVAALAANGSASVATASWSIIGALDPLASNSSGPSPPAARFIDVETKSATRENFRRSFLRHPGLAQAGEIGGFVQGTDLRHHLRSTGLHIVDGRSLQVGDT